MRTDQTTLCTRCAVRFAPAKRCPRCGGARLHDLRHARDRKAALPLLRAVAGHRAEWLAEAIERVLIAYVRWGFALLTGVAFVVGLIEVSSVNGAIVVACLAAGAQILVVVALVGVVSAISVLVRVFAAIARPLGRSRSAPPERRQVLPLPAPVAAATTDRERFVGRVRCRSPLVSPVGHERCAAFRVVGDAPGGAIDDAGLAPFELVDDDGEVCVVSEAAGTVLLDPESPARTVRPDDALRAFLDERGAYCELGAVRLAEAVLREGDRVIIDGVADATQRADGYRDSRIVHVLRDMPGAPLVIRRAPA
jgi:hypothetical protein